MLALDSLYHFYTEVYKFILKLDEYRLYVIKRKELAAFSAENNGTEAQGDSLLKEVISLDGKVRDRVHKRYQLKISEVDVWEEDAEPETAFALLHGVRPLFAVPLSHDLMEILLQQIESNYPQQSDKQPVSARNLFKAEFDYFLVGINPHANRKEQEKAFTTELQQLYKNAPTKRPRKKKSTIDHHHVFELYRTMKSFTKIAKMLSKNEEAVRKAYYLGFKESFGEPYNRSKFNKRHVPKHHLRRTCDSCPERSSCKTLCPDVASYVSQDYKSQREKPLPPPKKPIETL